MHRAPSVEFSEDESVDTIRQLKLAAATASLSTIAAGNSDMNYSILVEITSWSRGASEYPVTWCGV
jgi:hypothetical protein